MRLRLLLPLATVLLASCFPGDDFDTVQITGRYYVVGKQAWSSGAWEEAKLCYEVKPGKFSKPLITDQLLSVRYSKQLIIARTAYIERDRFYEYQRQHYYFISVYQGEDSLRAVQAVRGPFDHRTSDLMLWQLQREGMLFDSIRFYSPASQ